MISTVTISRVSTAEVAIDHPDEWTSEQIAGAVAVRQIDVAQRADMWTGETKTTIASIEEGVDYRDLADADAEGDTKPYRPDPVVLTDDDLPETPTPPTE